MHWQQLKSDYIITNPYIRVRKDVVRLPNNLIIEDYYVTEKNDVCLIVAVDRAGKILLKTEYRYPINEVLTELPGGTFERGKEAPLLAAKRELEEETGYMSDHWRELGVLYDHPTKDTNRVHVFLASEAEFTGNISLDQTEDIQYSFHDRQTVLHLVNSGEIKVSGTIAALSLAFFCK